MESRTGRPIAWLTGSLLLAPVLGVGGCSSGGSEPPGSPAAAVAASSITTATTTPTTVVGSVAGPASPSTPSSTSTSTLAELRARFTVSALNPENKRTAEAITSIFENSTPELQYGYSEVLNDGRGVTAGRAGFTSGTGDLVIVVRRYVQARPESPLAGFLPVLEDLARRGSDDVTALEGFGSSFAEAAQNAEMRAVQDAVVDELYYQPMLTQAEAVGAVLPLTLAVLYDTAIQHGTSTDPDGLPTLVAETVAAVGRPADGVDERRWLQQFLQVRRRHLESSAEPSTRLAWAATTVRCDALEALVADQRWALDPPLPLTVYGSSWMLR